MATLTESGTWMELLNHVLSALSMGSHQLNMSDEAFVIKNTCWIQTKTKGKFWIYDQRFYHVLFNLQRENHKYDQTDKSFVLLHKHAYPETKEVWLFRDSFPPHSLCPLKGREELTRLHRLLQAKQETRWTPFSLMLPSS